MFARWSGVPLACAAAVLAMAAAPACEKKVSVASDPGAGRALFTSMCARCHGAEGAGGPAPLMGGPGPRNLRDAAFQRDRTDEQIKLSIVNGKGAGMPPFGSAFSEPQLTALVAHVRSLGAEAGTPQ